MMNAEAVNGAYVVRRYEALPDGVQVIVLDCHDHASYAGLPGAMTYEGQLFGKAGWNSDTGSVYYRTDIRVAMGA